MSIGGLALRSAAKTGNRCSKPIVDAVEVTKPLRLAPLFDSDTVTACASDVPPLHV